MERKDLIDMIKSDFLDLNEAIYCSISRKVLAASLGIMAGVGAYMVCSGVESIITSKTIFDTFQNYEDIVKSSVTAIASVSTAYSILTG